MCAHLFPNQKDKTPPSVLPSAGGLTVDYRALTAGKDDWLFGYGMDTKERVRSLPFIAVANQRCRDADWATPEPTHNYLA